MTIKRSELKGILAGMVLGDSSLCLPKQCKNAHMRIQHGLRATDYLHYKADILKNLTEVTISYIGGKYPGITVRTRNHPLYTRLRELAYPQGKKIVSHTWVSWLTVHGLAIWYMDDGYLYKGYSVNKSGRRRIYRREITLSTCGFSLEENQFLAEFIKERFDIEFKVRKDGKYYRLRMGAIESNKFLEIVKPYIVPCMEYKLNMEYERPQIVERRAP